MTVSAPPASSAASPHPRAFRAASAVGFLLLGAAVSLYGPAVPLFRERYGVATATAGLALSSHAVASVVGVLAWGALDRVGRVRLGLASGAASVAVGALTVAFASSFTLVLVGVAAIGFGFGVVNTGINALFARDHTEGAATRLNVLHSMFGVGAVGFPLLLSVADLRVAFVTVAVLQLLVLPAMRQARDPGVRPTPEGEEPEAPRSVRFVLAGFLAVFVLYIGLELGVGNWMAAHLTDQGWSAAAAARWTSAYFLAFTIGRLLVARFLAESHPARIVIGSLALGGVAAGVASVDALTPYAYVAVGLVIAPVFPTAMVWLSRRLPGSRHAPAAAMLAGSAGAAVLPAIVGQVVDARGTQAVPGAVVVVSVLAVLAAVGVRRSAAR